MEENREKRLLEKIDYGSCTALIPARGGSKGVPKKNIRLLKGFPLIAYSIAAARLSGKIDRVVVSTDSQEIAEIAKKYGAEVPFLRPPEYAQDHSPDLDFVEHAIAWFGEHEGVIPEYLVHLRPTTPLRSSSEIDKAVELIMEDERATSLRSGFHCVHPPYKWLRISGSGYMEPVMPGMTCDETNLPRQDFSEIYIPNGYVDVLKSDFILKNHLMHGDRMIGFKTKEVPDIDTESDFQKLEIYQEEKEALAKLLNYLQGIG